jgi:hypothetical protein
MPAAATVIPISPTMVEAIAIGSIALVLKSRLLTVRAPRKCEDQAPAIPMAANLNARLIVRKQAHVLSTSQFVTNCRATMTNGCETEL